MSKAIAWMGLCGVCVGVFSAGALGAAGVLVSLDGPAGRLFEQVDGNPTTPETFRFEVVVIDPNGMFAVDSFQYFLNVSGAGVAFDVPATEAATDALVADAGHTPMYLFFGDSDGAWSFPVGGDPATVGVTDLAATTGRAYNPAERPSLGIVVLTVTDESAALAGDGLHTLDDAGGGFLIGSDEPLHLAPLEIRLPEPATLGLVLAGAAVVMARRRRRR